ncbi:DivIVA domain-containing protein [Dactylosporangium sp. NPDC051485]|uniref:DivIVA domain-containing protein n=1 Tax=Dactylosporangium sp. NPDC051485 TaxID=3154846 RepID=UPI003444E28D
MTQFATEFRGYDRPEVDKFVQTANDAIASNDPARRSRAQADAKAVSFRVTLRGYNRREVDHYLRRIAKGRPDDRT